ncbi:MFS transporter [Nonomuraea sp. KC401]|uniref:MFS transporter n=1 Tax=unclassified Nonomuraea TaxID=2593643 RepID=UPI0010FE7C5D|nr:MULTISPECIES: MFS transporter [unclassified Nonomuraea]NBE98436.1 MFS transporter [Nonomuraea sp. K271]TLF60989.1 MFS transporter [Nonomuraea sp. KC401]
MATSTSDIGDSEPAPRRSRLPRPFRPYRTGHYRLLSASLALSLAGSGMWAVTVAWQVIAIGAGPSELSLIAAASGIGLVGTALLGGVVADRASRRRIILISQLAKAVAVGSATVTGTMGLLTPAQLVAVAAVLGIADGFFYPAYSALVPTAVAEDDLLAANGIESMLRPTLMHVLGPAAASALISLFAPSTALAGVAGAHLLAAACAIGIRRFEPTSTGVRGPETRATPGHEPHTSPEPGPETRATPEPRPVTRSRISRVGGHVRSAVGDLGAGFAYLHSTPWLIATLAFAVTFVLVTNGPVQVLLPFVVRDQGMGGPREFALALACRGIGGVVGSLTMSALPLPRRYLSVMLLAWAAGCLPLLALGSTDRLWIMMAALFVHGALTSGAMVIWGTLLQRRVPPAMLGRVSSLDFFVSLSMAPLSMALAGPAAATWGNQWIFLVAGIVPMVAAVLAVTVARLPRDEIDQPLDRTR